MLLTYFLLILLTQRQLKWVLGFVVFIVVGCWLYRLGEFLWVAGIWLQAYACWRMTHLPPEQKQEG